MSEVDCDDVMLIIAELGQRTLTGKEETHLHNHLATCEQCRALTVETNEDWRWVARIPEDAFDDPNSLVLPVIDPIVFTAKEVIARGGMGQITRATDRRLGREVALKEVLESSMRQRFEREATITARLQHPAIIPIYEAGMWPDGSVFYTMRLVEGHDLAKAIGETDTIAERIALLPHVVAVTDALAYAHARKIIHRDLKPGNVLVGKFGETVVIDWGIAKELGTTIDDAKMPTSVTSKTNLTRVGAVLGTPGFMAPEQARGEVIDERADVYALGALLYNVLAGTPPFWDQFKNAELVIEKALLFPPTPIAELSPDAPADLHAIVEKAMARSPADRYPTAQEMAEELRRFQAGKLIAREYTLRELVGRWLSKHRTAVIVAAIAVTVLAVIAIVALLRVRESREVERIALVAAKANLVTARENAAATFEEQARTEVLAGDRARGLVYAVAALAAGRDTPELRYLTAAASRDASLHRHEIGPPDLTTSCGKEPNCAGSDLSSLGYNAAGELVLVEDSGRISIWRDGKRTRFFAIETPTSAQLDPTATRAVVVHDTNLSMWDVASGTRTWTLTDPTVDGTQDDLVFDHAAKWVVPVSDNDETQVAIVRDAATGAVVKELSVGGAHIKKVAFSDSGGLLAAAGSDGSIRVWRTNDFTELAAWKSEPDPETLAFVGSHQIAIDEPASHGIAIWNFDITPPRRMHVLPGHHGQFISIVVPEDAETIVTADDDRLRLWNSAGEQMAESRDARGRFERLTFVGDVLVASEGGNRLFMFERSTLRPRAVVDAHDGSIDRLAIDLTGHRIATSGSYDQRVHEWAMPAGPRVAQVAGESAVFVENLWVVATSKELRSYRSESGVLAATVAIDVGEGVALQVAGTRVLVEGKRRSVVVDPTGGGPAVVLETPSHLVLSPDGRYALAQDEHGENRAARQVARVWSTATGKPVREIALKRIDDAILIGDRLVIVIGSRLSIYEIASGAKVGTANIDGPRGENYKLIVDPRGTRLVAAADRVVFVFDRDGTELAKILPPDDTKTMTFSVDGTHILTHSDSGVRLWDSRTGKLLSVVDRDATNYQFSANGDRISTSRHNVIRIWGRTTGRQLDAFYLVHGDIQELAFNGTGTRLSAVADGVAILIDVHLETRSTDVLRDLANSLPWKLDDGIAVAR